MARPRVLGPGVPEPDHHLQDPDLRGQHDRARIPSDAVGGRACPDGTARGRTARRPWRLGRRWTAALDATAIFHKWELSLVRVSATIAPMTTERTPEAGPVDASIARLALLADPTRAALHRTLRDHETGITRDEAASAVGVSRSLVAFHLDRLVEAGLATVTYERRNGRTGPGAGRPRASPMPASTSSAARRWALPTSWPLPSISTRSS